MKSVVDGVFLAVLLWLLRGLGGELQQLVLVLAAVLVLVLVLVLVQGPTVGGKPDISGKQSDMDTELSYARLGGQSQSHSECLMEQALAPTRPMVHEMIHRGQGEEIEIEAKLGSHMIHTPIRCAWNTFGSYPALDHVVVDALDECDSKDGVDQILATLLSHAPGLRIKFFVTSRPEPRIVDQMQPGLNRGVPTKLDLHNLEHSVVREDIRTYLKVKLESPRLALPDANLEMLVDRSCVLFIYAATVVRYVGVDNFSRSTKRLAQVLAMSTSSHTHSSAEGDTLYEDIMKAALKDLALDESEQQEIEQTIMERGPEVHGRFIRGRHKNKGKDKIASENSGDGQGEKTCTRVWQCSCT
ncbi:hypothetical protein BDV93DRAFT_510201 [Ceratobasidium sp. AG-I]|nr:hypothetical protein BDV93DRAFT_510201 [Ceratobasidium sp. AG-I]